MKQSLPRFWRILPLDQLLREQSVISTRMLQSTNRQDREFYARIYRDLSAAIVEKTLDQAEIDPKS